MNRYNLLKSTLLTNPKTTFTHLTYKAVNPKRSLTLDPTSTKLQLFTTFYLLPRSLWLQQPGRPSQPLRTLPLRE